MRFSAPHLLLAGVLLAGCASAPRVYRYESLGFEVVAADDDTVDRACRERVKTNDYGLPISWNSRLVGCHLTSPFGLDELWVALTYPWVLVHELCHMAGIASEKCAKEYSPHERRTAP